MLLSCFKIPLWCFSLNKSCFYSTGLSLKLTFLARLQSWTVKENMFERVGKKMLILASLKHFFRGFQGHFSESEYVWEQRCRSNKKKKKRFQMAEKAVRNTDLARLGTPQIVVLHQSSARVAE